MKYILILLLSLSSAVNSKTIPLENFALKSEFKNVKISPTGKYLAYTFEDGDMVKLATMDMASRKGIYAFDVGKDREVVDFEWVNDERLYFVGGNITGWLDGADKDYRAYFANYDGKKREGIPLMYTSIISFLENDPDNVLITKYFYGESVKVHKMNVYTLKTDYLAVAPEPIGGYDSTIQFVSVDNNDEPRIAYEFDPVDRNNFDDDKLYLHVRVPNQEWTNLSIDNKRDKRPYFNDLGFSKDNTKFYFISNYDLPDKGSHGLFEYDFTSKKINLLFRDEDANVLGGAYNADEILVGVRYDAGYPDYFYLTEESVAEDVSLHKSLRASFPNSLVSIGRYTKDNSLTTLWVRNDKNPGDFYLFDAKDKKVNYLASSMPQIKQDEMARVEPFSMNARDGLKMFGQLTIPNEQELKDLPMVVYPHGGPYGVRDTWRWDARPQLLANNGYLVLQLNFRGSGGYGTDFEEAGHHEWGAKMQDDITDATQWAIKKGYADPDRICIHGVSYGGYASMQAVVKEPDLYKCAIPDAGPYDLDYQLRKADSFKQDSKRRKWFFELIFGPEYEQLNKERSPAYQVDKLKAKLLIVHGKEDERVPIGNAYLLEDELKKHDIKYETMYKKDGHGFQNVKYRIELYEKMLAFLDKHIGK
jgi:dipeptidyl aminopeptidase/acylaminoacyl peptidase